MKLLCMRRCADCHHPRKNHPEPYGPCTDCLADAGSDDGHGHDDSSVVCGSFAKTPTPGWGR